MRAVALNLQISHSENSSAIQGAGSIPGSGRSTGIGNGTPLQYSCLENSMGRGAWWAPVHGVAKSQTRMIEHAHGVIN